MYLGMKRWEMALENPTVGMIYSFYHCMGMTEPLILWRQIDES
jgi:hypothetical protein